MTKQFLKPVAIGILAGVALFMMPFFLVRVIFFFLILSALFRLFRGSRFWGGYRHRFAGFHPDFADHIRKMSEEEYSVFRQGFDSPDYPEVIQLKKQPSNQPFN